MKKLITSFGFLVVVATALAGCDLYFDGHNDPSGTVGGGGGGGGGSGYMCSSNTDCAAGCYCANGTCTEGGFCSTDADCGSGYHCDTNRSSCEPNPPGCTQDSDCADGQVCDTSISTCVNTCSCSTDAQAVSQGYGYCDETRMTCEKGSDPNGSCAGTVTCNTTAPKCASGEVPTILMGCYTGNCEAISACDTAPPCTAINDEADCLGRTDCSGVYTGIDCTKPDGSACHSGDANCTCASFEFASCATKGAGRVVTQSGETLDIPSALTLR